MGNLRLEKMAKDGMGCLFVFRPQTSDVARTLKNGFGSRSALHGVGFSPPLGSNLPELKFSSVAFRMALSKHFLSCDTKNTVPQGRAALATSPGAMIGKAPLLGSVSPFAKP